jgi:hypothetical protein
MKAVGEIHEKANINPVLIISDIAAAFPDI